MLGAVALEDVESVSEKGALALVKGPAQGPFLTHTAVPAVPSNFSVVSTAIVSVTYAVLPSGEKTIPLGIFTASVMTRSSPVAGSKR